jgi:hypothetical protein
MSRYYDKKTPGQSGWEDRYIKLSTFLWQNIYINMKKAEKQTKFHKKIYFSDNLWLPQGALTPSVILVK